MEHAVLVSPGRQYEYCLCQIQNSFEEVEDHPVYRTIAQTGQQGLINYWKELSDSSPLNAAIGMLNCSLRIHLLEFKKQSVKVTDTILEGPFQNCFIVNALHYMCPVEHFKLLLFKVA